MEARRVGIYLAQCERDTLLATLMERRESLGVRNAAADEPVWTRLLAALPSPRVLMRAVLRRP